MFVLYMMPRVSSCTEVCRFHFHYLLITWHLKHDIFLGSGTLLPLLFERDHSKLQNLAVNVTVNIKLAVVIG